MKVDHLFRSLAINNFEIRFLRSKGDGFQDLFSDIMEQAYPGDFTRVRPHGSDGDKKCDGYRHNGEALYQCYAPKQMKQRELINKMKDDFEGAKLHWIGIMKSWTFVHNDETGLPAQAVQLIAKFKQENPDIEIGQMSYSELLDIVDSLPEERLNRLFGPTVTLKMVASVDSIKIQLVVDNIKRYDPKLDQIDPIAPTVAKLKSNGLSKSIIDLIQGGFTGSARVRKFFEMHPTPDYADEIADTFKLEYLKLRRELADPNEIYNCLFEFAGGNSGDASQIAAVIAVLSYFFERCDIFEDAPRAT